MISDWLASKINAAIVGDADFTALGTLTMKLYEDWIGPDGSGTEVSGGSYAPQTATLEIVDKWVSLASTVTFTNMPGCELKSLGIWSGSDLVIAGDFPDPLTVGSGDPVTFSAGSVIGTWL